MNYAAPQHTVPAPLTARDSLAALLHQVLVAPNAGTHALAKCCATIAQAFAWLDQSDARLAARHSALREKALVMALAQALKVVEQYDLGWAITIASSLTASVAPLSGEPINLVVGTPCVFGAGCVHQGGA
jgi:hypothetical protein